jgi:predicted GNAT superfamily acetyltransferase
VKTSFPPIELSRIHVHGPAKFLLRVESSSRPEDYAKYERIRHAIWAFSDDHLAGTRNLLCENFFHDGTSLFIAAYAAGPDGELTENAETIVGFAYGFVGVRDKTVGFRSLDNLWFYSQYAGVRSEAEGFGLGLAIKEFQGDVLRGLFGIRTVVCTYDPLTAVNAHRNIHRFGMSVVEYRTAMYGEFGGRLNRCDVPSDRFFMSWDLDREAAGEPRSAAERNDDGPSILPVERRLVRGRTGTLELDIPRAPELDPAAGCVRLPIPADFYSMLRETDVDDPQVRRIPVDWRLCTREALKSLLARGFRIVDFRPPRPGDSGPGYILRKG